MTLIEMLLDTDTVAIDDNGKQETIRHSAKQKSLMYHAASHVYIHVVLTTYETVNAAYTAISAPLQKGVG